MSTVQRSVGFVLGVICALNIVLALVFVPLPGDPGEGLLLLPTSCVGLWAAALMIKRSSLWPLAALATSALYLWLVGRVSLRILLQDLSGAIPGLWWSTAEHVLLKSDGPWHAKAYYLIHHRLLVVFFLALGAYAVASGITHIWRRVAYRANRHA
jgi:hypothetical protein